jgi:hypothetical protein
MGASLFRGEGGQLCGPASCQVPSRTICAVATCSALPGRGIALALRGGNCGSRGSRECVAKCVLGPCQACEQVPWCRRQQRAQPAAWRLDICCSACRCVLRWLLARAFCVAWRAAVWCGLMPGRAGICQLCVCPCWSAHSSLLPQHPPLCMRRRPSNWQRVAPTGAALWLLPLSPCCPPCTHPPALTCQGGLAALELFCFGDCLRWCRCACCCVSRSSGPCEVSWCWSDSACHPPAMCMPILPTV